MNRLNAVFDLIPPDVKTVADIGYDHGKLVTKLILTRPGIRVIGVELLPRYAEDFWRKNTFRQQFSAPERIDLRLGDGLTVLHRNEADCLVLAGMGETRISQILKNSPEKLAGVKYLVLAPSHYFIKLREILAELGFYAAEERLIYERERYYLIVRAERGVDPAAGQLIWHFAPRLFEQRDPLLQGYLRHLKKILAVRMPFAESQHAAMKPFLQKLDTAIEIADSIKISMEKSK